ncbi:hypothetical protein ABG79_01341 [Caloramator mitchellensis]|uniref:Uncharacterized protein n=1 Tax=Caloramator mitchellensis TaxID=908809 RepID=A0A0R3K1T5_CALMK|nr:hypothetical protein [Caloramator mitchellensis]KRQ86850.1 hypothetical protein ABG79_01341 [Caloramator mitchellensis]
MKKGFVEIYILLIFFVIFILVTSSLDISLNNIIVRNNLENRLQVQYYSESGINHAIKLLEAENFPAKNIKYYLIIENDMLRLSFQPVNDKYIQLNINSIIGSNYIKYNISSNARFRDYYSYTTKELVILK